MAEVTMASVGARAAGNSYSITANVGRSISATAQQSSPSGGFTVVGAQLQRTSGQTQTSSSTYVEFNTGARSFFGNEPEVDTPALDLRRTAEASRAIYETRGSASGGNVHAEGGVSAGRAEAHGSAGFRMGPDGIEASAYGGVSFTALQADGSLQVGDGNLGLRVGADARVLSASAEGGARIGYAKNEETGRYELNAYVALELAAILAEGNVRADFSVAGLDVGARAGVQVGVGVSVDIGIQDGRFVFDVSGALGIGVNLKFSIGFNEEFLNNIQNFRDRHGIRYSENNPIIRVNTAHLRDYASRIDSVNNRIGNLDSALGRVWTEVSLLDVWDILQANLMTSESRALRQVRDYLNHAAERFDEAETKARGYMGG